MFWGSYGQERASEESTFSETPVAAQGFCVRGGWFIAAEWAKLVVVRTGPAEKFPEHFSPDWTSIWNCSLRKQGGQRWSWFRVRRWRCWGLDPVIWWFLSQLFKGGFQPIVYSLAGIIGRPQWIGSPIRGGTRVLV